MKPGLPSGADAIINAALDKLGTSGLTHGIVLAAVGQAYDPTRGDWWRRDWESAKNRILPARFPQWFRKPGTKKKKNQLTMFDPKGLVWKEQ